MEPDVERKTQTVSRGTGVNAGHGYANTIKDLQGSRPGLLDPHKATKYRTSYSHSLMAVMASQYLGGGGGGAGGDLKSRMGQLTSAVALRIHDHVGLKPGMVNWVFVRPSGISSLVFVTQVMLK